LLEKDPYEVFTGVNDGKKDLFIPKNIKAGRIIKKGRKAYYLLSEDGVEYALNNGHADDSADALTRMISTALRHGSDINFIVHQLEKTSGDLMSFSKVLARALKKYIKDGSVVSGEECPTCENKSLRRENGCISCPNCGWSKCS
jgi:ribonucleoside-diphosphate reductase alpha chain